MPRYDYRCEAGHKYELQQPFKSPVEHPCERCGKPARRVLVAPPLVFKSGGFYKTSGRDSSGSSSSDTKGVRSKTPPKKSEDTSPPSPSTSHSSPSTSSDD